MRRFISHLFLGVLAAPLLLISSPASAGPSACGNFTAVAEGQCEALFEGGCVAECTPLNFTAACDGQCTISADVECSGGCSVDCEAECTASGGSIDCAGYCEADCSAQCDTTCTDDTCRSQCKASCSNRCEVDCKVVEPMASCKAQCQASCDASCTVQANADCHVDCTADLKGGCEVQCKEPDGALFCNGQYVNVTGSFDDCLRQLEELEFDVAVDAHCDADGCEAVANCTACSTANAANSKLSLSAFFVMALGVSAMAARRRRRA